MSDWTGSPYLLPSSPLQDGYRERWQEGVIRTDMETGQAKMRARYTSTPRFIQCSYFLTSTQKGQLDALYVAKGGSGTFTWPDPVLGTDVTVRFLTRPSHRVTAAVYFYSDVALEVMP